MTSQLRGHVTDDVTPLPSRGVDVAVAVERKTSPDSAAADTEPVVSAMLVTSSSVCGGCVRVDTSTTQLPVPVEPRLSRHHTVFGDFTRGSRVSPSVLLATFPSHEMISRVPLINYSPTWPHFRHVMCALRLRDQPDVVKCRHRDRKSYAVAALFRAETCWETEAWT